MSFFAQRWGVSRGLSDNLPPQNPEPDIPKTPDKPQNTDMTAIEAAKDFYDQTGLSAKNFDADDRKKANELNEKFDAFKIPRYAVCSPRGGLSFRAIGESCNDKENIRYTSEKVLSRFLDNNYGVGLDTFKNNSITELRGKIKEKDKPEPKAKKEPKPKSESKPDKPKQDKPKSESKQESKPDKPKTESKPDCPPSPPKADKPKTESKPAEKSDKKESLEEKMDRLNEMMAKSMKTAA